VLVLMFMLSIDHVFFSRDWEIRYANCSSHGGEEDTTFSPEYVYLASFLYVFFQTSSVRKYVRVPEIISVQLEPSFNVENFLSVSSQLLIIIVFNA